MKTRFSVRFGQSVALIWLLLLSACTTTSSNGENDPRYDMVTPTWGEIARSFGDVVSSSSGERGELEVVVEASGETRSAARDEAIRTALQSTVSQLVVTDRLVEGSDLVKDEIYATQNGFVTHFEVLQESRSDYGEYEIRARVRVSEDTILNFVALQEGVTSEVDGDSLFAEVRRGAGQEEVLRKMFERFVVGYPWDVVSLELSEIKPVTGHSDRVEARLMAQSETDYFIALQQFMERVSVLSYRSPVEFGDYMQPPVVEAFVRSEVRPTHRITRERPLQVPSTHPSTQVCIAPRPRRKEIGFLGTVVLDTDERNRVYARCYLMPPGYYLPASWQVRDRGYGSRGSITRSFGQGSAVGLLVAFLDASGESAVKERASGRGGNCLLLGSDNRSRYPAPGAYMRSGTEWSPNQGLPFRLITQRSRGERWAPNPSTVIMSDIDTFFTAVFNLDQVDFNRVESFVGRPVISVDVNGQPYGLKHLGGSPMALDELCDELLDSA